MNRRSAAFLSCSFFMASLTALGAQDAKKTEEVKGDVKAIEGDWTSKDDSGESTWTFKDNKLSLVTPTRKYSIAIKIDPEAKPHKTMDFDVDTESPNAGGYKAKGIYKLDGDKMTICFGDDTVGRPKEFEGDFQATFLFELTRKKK